MRRYHLPIFQLHNQRCANGVNCNRKTFFDPYLLPSNANESWHELALGFFYSTLDYLLHPSAFLLISSNLFDCFSHHLKQILICIAVKKKSYLYLVLIVTLVHSCHKIISWILLTEATTSIKYTPIPPEIWYICFTILM